MKKIIQKRRAILFLGDLILFFVSLIIALLIGFGKNFSWHIYFIHLIPFSIILLLWIVIFIFFGLYELENLNRTLNVLYRIFSSMAMAAILAVIFFYLFSSFGITPKTNLLIFVLIFGSFLFLWRKVFIKIFATHFLKRVAIVGTGRKIENFILEIRKNPQLGYKIIGLVDENKLNDLAEWVQNRKIDIIVTAPKKPERILQEILYLALSKKIDIWDFPTAYEIIFKKIPLNYIDYQWFFQNLKEGEKMVFDRAKRVADIGLAILLCIFFSPLWLVIPLMIKLEDRGPIFYKQKRVGKNLQTFWLYKFRSMKEGAEKLGPPWTEKNDLRITKVGRLLRRTHLDELPQIINMLRGDISMVGPRPENLELTKALENEIPFYHLRHIIRPGFTGWAQIQLTHPRTFQERVEKMEYDLYYIKNRSLVLDVLILIKTIYLLFRPE